MLYSRRDVGKLALGALPVASLWPGAGEAATPQAGRPNSNFAGVQVGLNVPYSFGSEMKQQTMTGDDIIKHCVAVGLSAVELRSQPVEAFLGFPTVPNAGRNATPEQVAAAKVAAEELRKRRVSASMDQVRAFRRKFDDAGVKIEIVKYDGIFNFADDVADYAFTLAKTLGARAISCEINVEQTKRLGQFADRHQLMVGYHGHASTTPEHWEQAFSYAKYNGANLDIGHFWVGNKTSPVPFLEKHHARITHLHVKDRRQSDGTDTRMGEADTPVAQVLRLVRDRKWPIQATLEVEYATPPGSTRLEEIRRAVEFCRKTLLS
jgi:sugar phosphate isomerase/epimerase